jgi:integrase
MRGKLTKRSVEAIKPGARDTFLWDTQVRGFGCKVTPKGGRIYLLQYGRNGRDYRVTIGRHGVDYTSEQARIEALRLRGAVASGENPAIVRMQHRLASTVAELGERYMTEYAAAHKKPSAIAQDRRNLDNHIVPLIGKLSISAVERTDISRVMRDVATGKTKKDEKTTFRGRRIVRGGEIVANRVQALLSKMFQLAEEWKLRSEGTNPCRGIKHYAENKVERFLSTDELARLGAALAAAERGELFIEEIGPVPPPMKKKRGGQKKTGPRSEKPPVVAAIRLLLFTGCRVGEILSLRWSHVHIERKLLLLPDSKTGAKAVYLSEAAIQVLAAIKRNPDGDYVLEGNGPGRPILSLRKPWLHLCAAAKLENLRLHDLRHSFASVGAAGGLSLQMIGALLGHTQPATTARYAHLAASPLHEAANAIGAKMLAAMTSNLST